ncbi:MAG: retention module-containing protein, partial [Thiomicrorhabdus sp.]|nr:retention module-containing protein [Thiomicrorhabdus sp.]
MSEVIAIIVEIEGEVLAQNIDGKTRLLDIGDKLYEGEMIKTGVNGFVVLQLNSEDLVTIQGSQLIELTENVLAERVADQIDSIQQESIEDVLAILESGGDLTEQLEAPAAGIAGPGETGGAMTLRLLSLAESEGAEYQEDGGVPIVSRVVENVTPVEYTPDAFTEGTIIEAAETQNPLPGEENFPPVAVDDSAFTDEEQSVTIDVTQNDSMIDGATLTSATQGSNGTTQIVGNQIVYTPNTDFEGVDTFQYTITDEDGETSTATVTVTVNDEGAPVAVDDGATTDEEQSVTIDVTQNDSMIDGATLTSATQGSNGTTQIVGDQIVYTPNTDFEGVDTFQYTITDEDGETSTATVTVNVNPLNDPPIIAVGAFAGLSEANLADGTQPNEGLLTDNLGNFIAISDVDGGDGYWINGIAVVNPDGSLTGNTVTTTMGTLTFTSFNGSQLNYTYVLNDNTELDADYYDDSVIVRTDDGTTGGVVIKVAQVADDAPIEFTTNPVVIQSDGASSDSDSLNFASADGADGLGSVTFKTDSGGNLVDAPELYFDSGSGIQQVEWTLSANNTVVTGFVGGNEVITINLNGSTDSYSVFSNADGTFLAPGETLPTVNSALTTANSKDYSGAMNIGGSNVDIVVSGTNNVNTTPHDIGVGNQWINSGEEAVISFYTNSTLNGSSDTLTFDGAPESIPIVNFELVVYQ